MRLDQVSGWELMAVQILALLGVTPTLWLVGIAFQRSRLARWGSLLVAAVVGAAIATTILHSEEAVVSSYLFAACLFMLGTVAMAVCLLAAIPLTRGGAVGAMLAATVMMLSFMLTYYALFTFTPVRWIRTGG